MNDRAAVVADRPAIVSVLLIEDDLVDEMATVRTVLTEALPYRMEVVRSVAQARAILTRQSFDVILADYKLPDGTSFDLMDVFAEQLVIFVTGDWDEAAAARALRLGVHDYLIKDIDSRYLKLLHYRVATALRQRATERELRASEARLQAILDHAPAAISASDLAGRVILSNRVHAEITGPTEPADLTDTTDARYPEIEEFLTHRDGSEHVYLTVRFPMPDAAGGSQAVGAISVDITARKQAEAQIRHLAFFDPLTQLPNRRLLLDRMQQAFATSARHGGHGALFFIDLDHFKLVNDTLGHDHGDLLLVEVAERLLGCVRGEDTVARLGGDEFVVMAVGLSDEPRAAAAQAALVGDKILAAVSRPCEIGAHALTVTPSIGVTLLRGRELTADEVFKRADRAMYQAKAAGRGTLRFFDPAMQSALDARASLELDLRRALGAGQFELYLHSQVDGHREVVGAEALLRWHHPRLGVLLPEQFVPMAEQTGLILPIGQWAIDAACEQLARWAGEPRTRHLHLAINVSAHQFRQADFVEWVRRALQAHGIEPRLLRLELREGVLKGDNGQALACMNALKELGVVLVLDNFGIGTSSLQYLQSLPLDHIKIARTLIPQLPLSVHDVAVVRTIIGIGRDMGLGVLAAGIETEPQRECLEQLGCAFWQGWLFDLPSPALEFEARLTSTSQTATRSAKPVTH